MDNKDLKREAVNRGALMEMMIRSDGWKYIQDYITEKIRWFNDQNIREGFASDQYQYARGYVKGLFDLLVEVEESIKQANELSKSTSK